MAHHSLGIPQGYGPQQTVLVRGLTMLRPTPGSLESRRLEERPGTMPAALYLAGGRAASECRVVLLSPSGVEERRVSALAELETLKAMGLPLWVRLTGMGQPHVTHDLLNTL